MDVGLALFWQNYRGGRADVEVYRDELRLAHQAEDLGFDSIWTVEHHFTDYCVCPDPLQFLTYMAGRTTKLKLGTQVVILPWHDPIRVAENVSVLDIYSEGRLILGIGRGLGRIEFEGFGVPMGDSRGRFQESAEILVSTLETGKIAYDGEHFQIPERQLRPTPPYSFKDRFYSGAASPDSLRAVGELGLRLFVVPARGAEHVMNDIHLYREAFRETQGTEPAPTACALWVYCDDDAERAQELGHRYLANYYELTLAHYEMTGEHFASTKGYENYARTSAAINRMGVDAATEAFISLQAIGTPQQVYDKIVQVRGQLGFDTVTGVFNYGGMSGDDANNSMNLFAREVMPELQKLPALA